MINVVCAVIEDEVGKVLACLRPQGKALAGKWEFPGGKVEPDESAEDALVREIAEELDCEISVMQPLQHVTHCYPDFTIRLMPYLCRLTSGMPVPTEHDQVRWISLTHCPDLDWAEADVPIWQALKQTRESLLASDTDPFSE